MGYGTRTDRLRAASIAHLYQPFLEAAKAVLEPNTGIVLAKIADQVHCGAQQWQHLEFILAGRELGYTACDYDVKPRAGGIQDPKWTHRYHVRKPWSYWIVLPNESSCRGPGAALVRSCEVCGSAFKASRSDASTCSARCRQRRHRGRNEAGP